MELQQTKAFLTDLKPAASKLGFSESATEYATQMKICIEGYKMIKGES